MPGKATESSTKTVEIPEITLSRLTVVLEGQTPLITHRFGPRAMAAMEAAQQRTAKVAKPPRDPEAEFRDSLYVITDEPPRYGFPGAGIKKALVIAGGRFADEQMTRLRGVVNILSDLVPIDGSEPRMRTDAVRLASGVTSIAYRPEFWPWRAEVPVVYNAAVISEAQLLNLFSIAGFAVGLGDWRPERNGTFGQFSVKEARGT